MAMLQFFLRARLNNQKYNSLWIYVRRTVDYVPYLLLLSATCMYEYARVHHRFDDFIYRLQ
jgi:hypothetical protein